MKKLLCFSAALLGFIPSVHATNLIDVYREAIERDPTFRNAYNTYMSSTEAIPQARSALLPQIEVSTIAGQNLLNVSDGFYSSNTRYTNAQWQVTASQAVFNYQAWARIQQAKSTVKAAQATFNDAAQDLILRTAKAYFEVLLSQDTLEFAEAKKRANKRQWDQAQQRYEVGLDTITAVYEAKAAYDQSIATVIASRNNQINQNENLRMLTNKVYRHLAKLKNNTIPLVKPKPNNVKSWINTGLKQNYKLHAARFNLDIAKDNVKALSTTMWPVLSIQSNATQIRNYTNDSNSIYAPPRQTQANVALAMNFPLFQGGLVHSQTRQAQSDYQSTSDQMEQTYREVVINSRIAFNTIIDGISKVKADKQTIISQKNSLKSTEAQFESGTRTMVDVVNAQQRLFEAQQQLANDQYNLINSTLTLKYLAGTLNVNDLELVNSWLTK